MYGTLCAIARTRQQRDQTRANMRHASFLHRRASCLAHSLGTTWQRMQWVKQSRMTSRGRRWF
jgi:hypothetical protein